MSSFGEWPADRKPGTYAFERLPSQQARAAESDVLESSARLALEQAGFQPVAAGKEPDVLVQVGARDSRLYVVSPWDDPLWWRGGFGYWRHGPWMSPRWGASVSYDVPRIERQVALLIRDRATGKPLFETRASSEGTMRSDATLLTLAPTLFCHKVDTTRDCNAAGSIGFSGSKTGRPYVRFRRRICPSY